MIQKEKLAAIVGSSNVSDTPATLDSFAKDTSFVQSIKPDYVVKLQDEEQAEKLIAAARETKTPLIPVSSGAPHYRGDTVPTAGGAVIVDLSGMKKIIRVDRRNRTVLFEPGVTFGELIPASAKGGLRLNIPLMPRASKSVVGSMLEREPAILPTYHWDIADPLQNVEIVFGTGVKFRTGAAAGPGDLEDQWKAGGGQVEAAGPSAVSWYRLISGSQGSMGIVTWASSRCEILPQMEEPFVVGSATIDQLLEMVHWLVRYRIPNECFIVNNVNLAAMMAKNAKEYKEIKDSLPNYILFYNLAGYNYYPEKRIAAHIVDATAIAQKAQLETARAAGAVAAFDILKAVQAPSAEPYWKTRVKGEGQDTFFITKFQSITKTIDVMYSSANKIGYPATDLGVYVQPIVQGANFHVEFNLFYNPADTKETAKVRELISSSVNPLIAAGAFFSRPYGEITRGIMNKDAATLNALRKVKAICDPDNIMNPGKLCF
jgi:FAD/FMN-containing dehydrogenase